MQPVVVVTFFEGKSEIRIISAQKPTKSERKYYEEGHS
jgi:uncharacterized DUF497 family protein